MMNLCSYCLMFYNVGLKVVFFNSNINIFYKEDNLIYVLCVNI